MQRLLCVNGLLWENNLNDKTFLNPLTFRKSREMIRISFSSVVKSKDDTSYMWYLLRMWLARVLDYILWPQTGMSVISVVCTLSSSMSLSKVANIRQTFMLFSTTWLEGSFLFSTTKMWRRHEKDHDGLWTHLNKIPFKNNGRFHASDVKGIVRMFWSGVLWGTHP